MVKFNPWSVAKKNNLEYSGDVNIEYGGTFFNLSTFNNGYVDAVRVTDLDSATGFDGAIMVENLSINGTLDKQRIANAVRSMGWDIHSNDWHKLSPATKRLMIAESLMYKYGGDSEPAEVYQPNRNEPDSFDGWHAERLSWTNIFKMLRNKLCNL